MVSEALLFRVLGMVVGLALAFFSFRIMKATKGATKGWLIFCIAGLFFFLWTSFMSLFTITDIYVGRVITSILFIPGTVVLAMGSAKLVEDFGIIKPKLISAKNYLIMNLSFIVVFAILLFIFNDDILQVILTSVFIDAIIANIMAMVALFYLWKTTRKYIWISFFVFTLLFSLGQVSSIYSGNCCTGELSDLKICEGYELDYTDILNIPCNAALVNVSMIGYNLLTISGLILVINFFYLWRKLS